MSAQNPTANDPSENSANEEPKGPGSGPVGAWGIALLVFYLLFVFSFGIYVLIAIWPHCLAPAATTQTATPPPPAGGAASPNPSPCINPNPEEIQLLVVGKRLIWWEVRLLVMVIIAGALGALLHCIRSVFWYVGHRDLLRSWVLMYLLLPFSGSLLAVAFYLVIRGGFFPQAAAEQSSPIAFVALGLLVGLFSTQASLKLKDVFETLFARPQPGANTVPQASTSPTQQPASGTQLPAPKIATVSPPTGPVNGGPEVTISGVNFQTGLTVKFGETQASVTPVDSNSVKAIPPDVLAAGAVDIVVSNPDGQSDTLSQGYTYV